VRVMEIDLIGNTSGTEESVTFVFSCWIRYAVV